MFVGKKGKLMSIAETSDPGFQRNGPCYFRIEDGTAWVDFLSKETGDLITFKSGTVDRKA